MSQVRCADCGFLTCRNPESRENETVSWEMRRQNDGWWHLRSHVSEESVVMPIIGIPDCLMAAADLPKEQRDAERLKNPPLLPIHLGRECKSFFRWNPGRTPKEHLDMQFHAELQRQQAEWQAAQEQNRQKWEAAMRRDDRIFQFATALIAALVSGFVAWLGQR